MSLQRLFNVGKQNAHYVGEYSERDMQWRRLGAKDKAANLLRLLGSKVSQVQTVLEVGCGTGAVLNEVARSGAGQSFVGIDVADPDEHAETLVGTDMKLFRYDGKRIPYPDRSFDLVFASHVLEHVEDERELLRELARVSANFVYVEVPCELHARTTHDDMQRTLNIGHINSYTPKSFALTLQTSGLSISDIKLFDHSLAVYSFNAPMPVAIAKSSMRKAFLGLSEDLAARLFSYHCGALCVPTAA